MIRTLGLSLALLLAGLVPAAVPAQADTVPTHAVSVSGVGVATYPAFRPDVERYAVTTTAATGGALDVVASTSDPDGTVLVDGRPADGTVHLTGLDEGDEVSVVIQDGGGTAVHSLVYLPAGFPKLTETVPATAQAGVDDVLVTLGRFSGDGSLNYEAALDHRGVPSYVRSLPWGTGSADLKPGGAPGHYTVSRTPPSVSGRTGSDLVELDDQFQEVRRLRTTGLVDTDSHDSILAADGHRFLVAYEHDAVTGLTDAVIQEQSPTGQVIHTWDSGDHLVPAAETTSASGQADYAHINSISLTSDGDVLASFRHLSSVYKIAWSAHDGFARGDVVWRLGGRHSDFTFPGDPTRSGPCAQHDAQELPNGHLLLFDNGSVALNGDPARCIDPDDPTGATVARNETRVVEYALDLQAHTATPTWSWSHPGGWFAFFAGSARRLAGGDTLVGWAGEKRALATEVAPSGTIRWELRNDDNYLTYRAIPAHVPDATPPVVAVTTPAQGATFDFGQSVAPDFTCTDRGGSSLQTCTGSRQPLPTTSPGAHTYTVTATDGAGHTTTTTRSYTVRPQPFSRPDLMLHATGGAWTGNNVHRTDYATRVSQTLRRGATGTAYVRLQNEGNRTDRIILKGTGGGPRFRVRWFYAGTEITDRVLAGTWRPVLAAGATQDLRVSVTRLAAAPAGAVWRVALRSTSTLDPSYADTVAVDSRAVG